MRLAVLADIHAILPALETALAEIERDNVDAILVAGDMLAGPNPLETIRRLRGLNCHMIRGNQENYILDLHTGQAPDWCYTSQQWSFMRWNYSQLNAESLQFIASLPEQRSLSFPGMHAIRLVHGSPRNVSELVYPERDPALLDLTLSLVAEPVLIFGHTHLAWQMRRNDRLALNPGALSGNFTGKPCGSYALLDWEDNAWRVTHREVQFDLAAIQAAFSQGGLQQAADTISYYWLLSLETGVNHLPRFIDFAFEMTRQAGFAESPYIPDLILEQAHHLFAAKVASQGEP